MSEQGFFKKALWGFHKQSVLDYIDRLNAEHEELLGELEDELAAAQDEADANRLQAEEAVSLREAVAALQAERQQRDAAWTERMNELVRQVRERESVTAQTIREKDQMCGQLQEQVTQLREQITALQDELDESARCVFQLRAENERLAREAAAKTPEPDEPQPISQVEPSVSAEPIPPAEPTPPAEPAQTPARPVCAPRAAAPAKPPIRTTVRMTPKKRGWRDYLEGWLWK